MFKFVVIAILLINSIFWGVYPVNEYSPHQKILNKISYFNFKITPLSHIIVGTMFLVITAAVVCFPSICIWAIFGNSLRIFIKNTKVKKITEYILAILLVLTALVVLLK